MTEMDFESAKLFQQELEESIGKKLKLKINNNRSTMVSVRWEPDTTVVSLHRMFLQAPPVIRNKLISYLRCEKSTLSKEVKSFIEDGVQGLDYSHHLDVCKIQPEGEQYNLLELYHEVNNRYFFGELDLRISWFGKKGRKNRSRFTLGHYSEPLKLIKIHKTLDCKEVPRYLISYIIYHEMLHSLYPPYVDQKGVRRIHHHEFVEREKQFTDYLIAKEWILNHRERFFTS